MKKRIAVLGSTGSIGVQTLEVVRQHPDKFEIEVLTANSNADLLIKQAIEFLPNAVVIADESKHKEVKDALFDHDIKVFTGAKSLEDIVEMESIDIVLVALVGFAGLLPTLRAIEYKKPIALANKETLVVGGSIVSKKALENKVPILPVDSEHSAIFQCLIGEFQNKVEKIYLTASGGPFRGKDRKFLENVTKADALKHPNWDMGAKITIDSASLMNKGLEVIEAKWLFDLTPEQIDVIVHPQSIVHSLVQFEDGSLKAQLGLPDMKLPIMYALTFPERIHSNFERFDFMKYPSFTFEKPDYKTFTCLPLAFQAINKGGNMPCILNAANEVAVDAFLREKISFLQIPRYIEDMMNEIHFIETPTLDDLLLSDKETREKLKDRI
ncbi:1-deoxy-D-xylulose-5-phosphate reductoisomerase [Bacteroidales bacterium OttesenSCG-928-C19]|nr:1-deoxy-D-xylulose-5-phosphate reductoisomerase [Bacteroidales bacterium OttesenSCG-928-C19]